MELDGQRKENPAADPKTQQRIDQLEAQVMRLSTVIDVLMKKLDTARPEK